MKAPEKQFYSHRFVSSTTWLFIDPKLRLSSLSSLHYRSISLMLPASILISGSWLFHLPYIEELKCYKDTYMLITNKAKQLLTTWNLHTNIFANVSKMLLALLAGFCFNSARALVVNACSSTEQVADKFQFLFRWIENFWKLCARNCEEYSPVKTSRIPLING